MMKKKKMGKGTEEACFRGEKDRGKVDDTMKDVLTIGEFFRNRFKSIKEGFKSCIRIFFTNLLTSVIPTEVVECIKSVDALIDHIGRLLTSDDITSVELMKISIPSDGKKISIPYDGICLTTSNDLLCESKVDCFEILTLLREMFYVPQFFDKNLLREYCLQNDCLVFCTASGSSTLQTEDMKPFKMLVIGEGAQLKECESAVPLLLPGIHHAILVGDERQLHAMIKSEICADADFGRSMFERLVSLGQRKHLLNVCIPETLKKPHVLGGPLKVYGVARRPKAAWFPSSAVDRYITLDASKRPKCINIVSLFSPRTMIKGDRVGA